MRMNRPNQPEPHRRQAAGVPLTGISAGRRPPRLPRWSGVLPLLWATMAAPGCVVLPAESGVTEPLPLVINIDTRELDPVEIDEVIIDRGTPAHIFDVTKAVTSSDGRKTGFRYHWYYDFDAAASLPLTASSYGQCTGHAQCILGFCSGLSSVGEDHTLMLVVSTGDLKEGTKDPLDFVEGVAFDWVSWRLKMVNECPG